MTTRSESSKPRSRLGRGLSSLLSLQESVVHAEVPEGQSTSGVEEGGRASNATSSSGGVSTASSALPGTAVAELRLEMISPNPHQPRRDFDPAALAELAASLKSTGLIQPIIVKKVGDRYQLIAGERRLRAAKLAELATIPAIIRDADSYAQAQMALVENIQRKDLNPLDRAAAYHALMSQLGLTQAELSTRLGEERTAITHFLRLLDLDEPVAELLRSEKITLGHAKLLAGVDDSAEQVRLAELVVSQDLSVRNLERLLREGPQLLQPRAKRSGSAHVQELERSLSRQLGLRVQVQSGKGGKGRIIIHYGSLDQFDGLAERLGVSLD